MRNNIFRAALALGVAGAIAFGAGTALAAAPTTAGCQKKVELNAGKFQASLAKALTKCADFIQGEISKGAKGIVANAADKCETALAGVYGTGKAVDKFRAAMTGLYPLTCSDQELVGIGHLLSGGGAGASAPGSTVIKFATDYLLVTGEFEATRSVINQTGTLMSLILQAQEAKLCPAGPPNLCSFKVECKTVGCKLGGASGALLNTATLGPIALSMSGTEPFDMCSITGPLAVGTESGIIYISGGPSRTLAPINIPGVATVCVDSQRGTGWCDCTGHALHLNTNFCQDRLVNPAVATDLCGAPTIASTPDRNFPGSKLGLPVNSPFGSSLAGDCYDQSTVQFTIVGLGSEGPDTLPCTADDVAIPSAPVPVPLTTGTAQAQVLQAVTGYGSCQDDETACVETKNCLLVPGTALCKDVATATLPLSTLPGAGLSCNNYQTGQLAGLKLVGAFPSGGGDAPLGDSITSFTIDCVP